MRIFGIDPGSTVTGYGVIDIAGAKTHHIDNGVVRPKAGRPYLERLHHIFVELERLLAQFRPSVVAIEQVFLAKNAHSALQLGQARGVALLAAARAGCLVHEYATRTVKQSIVGVGSATKQQIQFMISKQLALPEAPAEDAADALAIALTHARLQSPQFAKSAIAFPATQSTALSRAIAKKLSE